MSTAIAVYTMSAKAKPIRMVVKKSTAALRTSETKLLLKAESNDRRDGSKSDYHNLNNDNTKKFYGEDTALLWYGQFKLKAI